MSVLRQEAESRHAQWQEERLQLTTGKTRLEEKLKLQLETASGLQKEVAQVREGRSAVDNKEGLTRNFKNY